MAASEDARGNPEILVGTKVLGWLERLLPAVKCFVTPSQGNEVMRVSKPITLVLSRPVLCTFYIQKKIVKNV